MALDPALADANISKSQHQYQVMRTHLQRVLSGLDAGGIEGLVEALEQQGLNATVKRLHERPGEFGFQQAPSVGDSKAVELGLKAFLEARDNLDVAVAKSPARFENGQLMAFDGQLGRVQGDGRVVMLAEVERQRERKAENDAGHDDDGEDRDREI
jgi:hypothetical protein